MRARPIRARLPALVIATVALATCGPSDTGSGPAHPVGERAALARDDIVRHTGEAQGQLRTSADPNQTFDLRGYVVTYWPPSTDADLSPISIGKDDPAFGTVVVGGSVLGRLPRDATWQQIKSCCDAEALRLEGTGWMVSYGFVADDVEDGFAPRVLDGTETGNDVAFVLSGCRMSYIRDDAVENDDLMPGVIRDCLFDGVNRFLSERPTRGRDVSNTDATVSIQDVLVRMQPMPNDFSEDGIGNGSIFKWSDGAGRVDMRDSIIYVEERSQSSVDADTFPPGTYRNVTLVLGPRFDGDYPAPLPPGVSVTRDVEVWKRAKDAWIAAHPDVGAILDQARS